MTIQLDPSALAAQMAESNLGLLTPELCLLATLLVILVGSLLQKSPAAAPVAAGEGTTALVAPAEDDTKLPMTLFGLGSLTAFISLVMQLANTNLLTKVGTGYLVMDVFRVDLLSWLIRALIVIGTLMVGLFMQRHIKILAPRRASEILILLLTASLGAMLLSGANELVFLFVALETLSIPSYILAGMLQREDTRASEASFKYLVYGGVASAFLLMGFSLWYGLSGGQTHFDNLAGLNVAMGMPAGSFVAVMVTLIVAGLGFKLSVAPFHMWTPDVYEGAPTPVTTFLGTVSKLAAFAVAFRIASLMSGIAPGGWQGLLTVAAVLSMTVGNLIALRQTNLKRLFAYSTIAHSGYMLLGLIYPEAKVSGAMFYYLLAYLFMSTAGFGALIRFQEISGSKGEIADMDGLVQKRPSLVFALTIALLSLAGIPITSGFFAKFFLFQSLYTVGPHTLWIVIVALLNSTVSLFYYVNVIRRMVIEAPSALVSALPAKDADSKSPLRPTVTVMLFSVIITLALGVFGDNVLTLCQNAAQAVVSAAHVDPMPQVVDPNAPRQH